MKCQNILSIAATVASVVGANAATVDINGKTYEFAKHVIELEAELGQSVTKSFADVISETEESAVAHVINTSGFQENGQAISYYYSDPSLFFLGTFSDVTGFAISNYSSALQDGTEYFVYDLTFAPTVETVANTNNMKKFGDHGTSDRVCRRPWFL